MKRRRTVAQIERDAQAVEYRRRGLSYRQIAAQMGWKNQASAYEAVQRGLADSAVEASDEVRRLEVDRLDEMRRHALRVLATPHMMVSQGVVVTWTDPKTGEETPVPDDTPVLLAIDRLVKISERTAKLLGLDAPVRHEVITLDAIEAEIARLNAAMGRAGDQRAVR